MIPYKDYSYLPINPRKWFFSATTSIPYCSKEMEASLTYFRVLIKVILSFLVPGAHYATPVEKHMPLNSKSCEDITRAVGQCKQNATNKRVEWLQNNTYFRERIDPKNFWKPFHFDIINWPIRSSFSFITDLILFQLSVPLLWLMVRYNRTDWSLVHLVV